MDGVSLSEKILRVFKDHPELRHSPTGIVKTLAAEGVEVKANTVKQTLKRWKKENRFAPVYNRSELIRQFLAKGLEPAEVARRLAGEGGGVTLNLVKQVRRNMERKKKALSQKFDNEYERLLADENEPILDDPVAEAKRLLKWFDFGGWKKSSKTKPTVQNETDQK